MNGKPRVGDTITYQGKAGNGVVQSVDGNLCWTKYERYGDAQPFIWRFKDGLNTLHSWPNKSEYKPDTCPGCNLDREVVCYCRKQS